MRPIDADELLEDITAAQEHGGMGAVIAGTLKRFVMRQPTLTPQNEPLTIEQLREMDGEPVWVDAIQKVPTCVDGWCVVFIGRGDWSSCALIPGDEDTPWEFLTYGTVWLSYLRPPERQEDEHGE